MTDRAGRAWLFLGPALAVLVSLFALPAILLFAVSFWEVRSFRLAPALSVGAWAGVWRDYAGLAAYTVGIGLAVSALTTVLGLAFALAARFALRRGDRLMIAVLITLFGGYLVKIYAWKSILGADGLLNQALIALGLTGAPLQALIYSRGAVIVALVHFLLPFAILPLYAGLRNVSDAAIEAARDLGASRSAILWRVVLPQVRGGLFAAVAFTFLLAAGDYVTPMLLGGPGGTMLGQFVLLEFSTNFDWPAGAALSYALLGSCLLVLAVLGAAIFGQGRRP
jgi:spermidine/putrescine transport system permease protein